MTEVPLRHSPAWYVLTGIYFLLAMLILSTGVTLVIDGGPITAIAALIALGLGTLATSILALAGARRAPSLTVEPTGLRLDLPGILRHAAIVPKQQIRHVYLRDPAEIQAERTSRWLPAPGPVSINIRRVPALSLAAEHRPDWTLLVVLEPAFSFRRLVRRTMPILWYAAFMVRMQPDVPGPFTQARGLVCEPQRLQEAVDALYAAGYPVTRPPIADTHLRWLNGG